MKRKKKIDEAGGLNTMSCVQMPPRPSRVMSALVPSNPLSSTALDPHFHLTSHNHRQSKNVYVLRNSIIIPSLIPSLSAQFTENPFSSTHSLDTNPFDDPAPDTAHAARMEEIAQRERDLERREAELTQKADHIKKHGRNNFPPCTSPHQNIHVNPQLTLLSVYPLIYHSISEEIPEPSRPLITRLFQLWFVLAATLLFNMVASIVNFAVGAKDGGSDLGSSIGYSSRN